MGRVAFAPQQIRLKGKKIDHVALLAVPYLPTAFPDELLGSWLSRMVLLNGEPSFVAFFRTYGFDINAKSTVADPINGANYVRAIASSVGIDYEVFLRTFSTKSYWDAFRNSSVGPETKLTHKKVRARLSPPLLRLCPGCVEDDLQDFGCPYFHRAHHLKSKVCTKHRLNLQDSCGICARPLRTSSEMTIVPMQCQCGASLLTTLKRVMAEEQWHAFAEFSFRALNANACELEFNHLVPIAINRAVEICDSTIDRSLRTVLNNSYGANGFALLCKRHGDQVSREAGAKNMSASTLTPDLAIAVLVGCGLNFDDVRCAIAAQKLLPLDMRLVPTGSRGPKKVFKPANVAEAKELALAFSAESQERAELRFRRPFVYWMLFLDQREWLYSWIHEDGRRTLTSSWDEPPSLEHDRQVIREDGSRLSRSMARARAYTRDRIWLEEFDQTRVQVINRSLILLDQLTYAKTEHCREAGRPIKWTVASAAKRLRIPPKTLTAFAQRDAGIRALVPETAVDFKMRVIVWAADEAFRVAELPTPTAVLKIGLLTGSSKTMKLISSVIAERASKKLRET